MTVRTGRRRILYCSFCGKSQDDVGELIGGPGDVFVCNECVDLCMGLINERLPQMQASDLEYPVKSRTPPDDGKAKP